MVLRWQSTAFALLGRAPLVGVQTVTVSELADGHSGQCYYSRLAEVMEQLDAARDNLLDEDDQLVGRVKDKEEVEKSLRHKATSCFSAMYGDKYPFSSSSCLSPRTNCTNG
jgi:hypothetical protein